MAQTPADSQDDTTPPSLQMRLFGPLHVQIEGAPMPPLRARKLQWLLALLVLRPKREVDRAWLAGTLWPDSEQSQALFNLRQSLPPLRAALGAAASRLGSPTPRTLTFDLAGAEVDVVEFDAALQHSDRASLQRAVELYGGPLLEGCTEDWVLQERQVREQGYLRALEGLAELAVGSGESAVAAGYLRLVIGMEPLRESAHRSLMQALASLGDYGAVVEVYRDLRLLLHEQLNASPDVATTALFEALRAQARSRARTGRLASPSAAVPTLPSASALPSSALPSKAAPSSQREAMPATDEGDHLTLTLLFTDIEGSTPLWEQYPQAMREALSRHDLLLREAIEGEGGEVFKTVGDAFCAVFKTAEAALRAALAGQRALQTEAWPSEAVLKVRMVLHTGAVERREGDYFGASVNRVARLLSIGHGGQTLLSGVTQELLGSGLPSGVSLRERGSHRIKGVEQALVVFEVRHADLAGEFPALRSLSSGPNNLPVQLSTFIGRVAELSQVKELLGRVRLLTLTGSGGCGKTRLALEAASEVLSDYADGVWLVELAALTEPSLLAHRVLVALGVREEVGRTVTETLLTNLVSKRMLLVLDNCEHLVEVCAHLADRLLHSCPNLSILATSREALKVEGEHPWRVPGMEHPALKEAPAGTEVSEKLLGYDACRLFVERARVHRPELRLTGSVGRAVASVCGHLDGIPLALELAAARTRSLSMEEIERRLDHRFRLLTGGNRDVLPRHQTLRALMDWSYELLDGEERLLLQRVSVFSGGWTLEAAEAVCAKEQGVGSREWGVGKANVEGATPDSKAPQAQNLLPIPYSLLPSDVLDLLTSLVDKSLVIYEEREEASRYRLLESVREYAREKLGESGEEAWVADRHRDWYVVLAEEAAPRLRGADQGKWLSRLERDHDNLRAALSWSLKRQGTGARATLRLCGALQRFWEVRGYLGEGRGWCASVLASVGESGSAVERARVLNGAGGLARLQGDYAAARTSHEQSLAIFREIGDRWGSASSLNNLGSVAFNQGDYASAQVYYEQSLAIQREIGDRGGSAISLNGLGIVAYHQGDNASARAYYEQSLEIKREIGDRLGTSQVLGNLGLVVCDQGDNASAQAYYEQSLEIKREIGDRGGIASSLNNLGIVAYHQGDNASAQAYYEQSLEIKREIGDRGGIVYSLNGLGRVACNQGDYAAARAYHEEGLAISREIGDRQGIASSLNNLGIVAYFQCDYASVRAYQQQGLVISREIGNRKGIAYSLEGLAELASAEGAAERGVRLWGAAEALREQIGSPLPPGERETYERKVDQARSVIAEESFAQMWGRGRAMTLEEALFYALEGAEALECP